jgi:acyl-coenzyme A synthetase/AMP-(fatty) acid ligase
MDADLLPLLQQHGDRVALVHAGAEYTYRDLAERVVAVERFLAEHDVRPRDCVVLQGDFAFDAIATLLALQRARCIVAPVTSPTELAWEALNESCAPVHLVDARQGLRHERLRARPAELQPLVGRLAEAGASGLILLSSGSTGRPKVILHNLDLLLAARIERRHRSRLTILLFLLFDHIGGINTLLNTLAGGSTGVALEQRTPEEVCVMVARHQVRILPTTPTFINLLLVGGFVDAHDLSCIKLITYGTEPMPEPLLARVRAALPNARLLQTFGTSETGISSTMSESSRSTYFKMDDDRFEHRVVDGELHLRSPTQFLGYLNQPTENVTSDGWFRTGDLVEPGADGYFRIKGRLSDTINVGGEKVLPLEVESVLLTSPIVDDCVVYGEPNALTGQHVCAEVKLRRTMSRAELRAHVQGFLRERLAPYKVPVRVLPVEEIRRSERFKKTRVRG